MFPPGFDGAAEGEAVSGETAPAGSEQAKPGAAAGQNTPQQPAGPGRQGKHRS